MGSRSLLRRTGIFAAAALLVAACASGNRGANPDAGGTGGAGEGGGSPASAEAFGDLPVPCGEGDAKGATEQGVTDSTITIAYGDDRGFAASPGLSHYAGDAVQAFIKWCNEEGGINGREVVGTFYDAKVTEANNVMTDACASAFMLVGQAFALDSAAEQTRVGCNLVSVQGFSVSPEFTNGPMQFQVMPNPTDYAVGGQYAQMAKLFPDKVKKAALLTTTLATENFAARKAVEAAKAFGWNWLPCTQTINYSGEPDYKPFMQKFKDCGAEIVFYAISPGPLVFNFLQAASQVEFEPTWLAEGNNYTQEFADFNESGLADNVYARTAYIPQEQAELVPAVKQYIDIVRADGGDTSQLGAQAASAFLLWATAAKKCGSTLTRQCMVNELSKIKEWTGGGLHATSNPGDNLPPTCGMLLHLEDTAWTQAVPDKEATFDCSPTYRVELPADFVPVELGDDRVATRYLTDKVIRPQT